MMETPHDDNASLIAFYGNPHLPGWQANNLVPVAFPWRATYGNLVVSHIMFHAKAAPALLEAFSKIWDHVAQDQARLNDTGLQNYSGAFNDRLVRGAALKMSVHAVAAAIDFDAQHEPMNYEHVSHMAQFVIDIFKSTGATWGGDFRHRQDPMHFQYAHE